jgi:hypothetical protein
MVQAGWQDFFHQEKNVARCTVVLFEDWDFNRRSTDNARWKDFGLEWMNWYKIPSSGQCDCEGTYSGFLHLKGDFFPGYSRRFLPTISSIYFRTILTPRHAATAEPADQVFHTVSQKYQQANYRIQFHILPLNSRTFQGFAEYCLEIKDISGSAFSLKDIQGIPGAVRTLILSPKLLSQISNRHHSRCHLICMTRILFYL